MSKNLQVLLAAARPRQWLKNFALFVPLIINGRMFSADPAGRTITGFIVFCLLSSSNYILNDIIDAASDRMHPFKKQRPIASRRLSIRYAVFMYLALLVSGFSLASGLGSGFVMTCTGFLLLHYASFFVLRRIAVLDVLAISGGYLLRILAGEQTSGYHISIWLFLAVLSLSLLLAIGKRRAELTLLKVHGEKMLMPVASGQFPYSEKLLDSYVAMFANASYLTYAYFTFLTQSSVPGFFSNQTNDIFIFLPERKYLMITIPFVIYGIMRYLQLVYSIKHGSLEKAVTGDKPLLTTLGLWGISTILVIYVIGG